MSAYPSLPIFVDAYLADTSHLTCEEQGAYLQLLMIAWRSPRCSIPDDDARIVRTLRITRRKWAALKPNVMGFWRLENGFWEPTRQHFGAVERTRIAPDVRAQIMAEQQCDYCGTEEGPFEVDHIIPLARGGTNHTANLTLACRTCNRSKKDKLVREWLA